MTTFGESGIDAVVEWGPKVFFFRGTQYIRVTRTGTSGPGQADPGYPKSIDPHWGFPQGFGQNGISAAMIHPNIENIYYFFSEGKYIVVQRAGDTGPGRVLTKTPLSDEEFFPAKGINWKPIDACFRWGVTVSYFFRGDQFATLRHRQGADPGSWSTQGAISAHWSYWPPNFGDQGIDDAFRWGNGAYVYVFSGSQYIKIYTEGATGLSGNRIEPGYPRPIHPHWNFPKL